MNIIITSIKLPGDISFEIKAYSTPASDVFRVKDIFIVKEIFSMQPWDWNKIKHLSINFRGYFLSDPDCMDYFRHSFEFTKLKSNELNDKEIKFIGDLILEVYPEIFYL